jgi:hypothetical protein
LLNFWWASAEALVQGKQNPKAGKGSTSVWLSGAKIQESTCYMTAPDIAEQVKRCQNLEKTKNNQERRERQNLTSNFKRN